MTPHAFRKLALSFAGATEAAHQRHPDFRVGGKIFATLSYPDRNWGMVKLTSEQQADFMHDAPAVFSPSAGAWGRQGCTRVFLRAATRTTLLPALEAAWSNVTLALAKAIRSRRRVRIAPSRSSR
ncbi:MAG TPA: MmcQ/YjbR family DNA-binding protein [Candidatus Acidoferrales bacterium]|nr:MmcQ/YjbR family DNA-binding protein [Candidatus Acidoferrales bacterium]